MPKKLTQALFKLGTSTTIYDALSIKKELLIFSETEATELVLDCSGVQDCDLTILQLIRSLQISSIEDNKKLISVSAKTGKNTLELKKLMKKIMD